jgi:hypothetical protein
MTNYKDISAQGLLTNGAHRRIIKVSAIYYENQHVKIRHYGLLESNTG